MALINDYITKLEIDYASTLALVAGAEDNLDIAQGESTLSPETVTQLQTVFTYLKARRNWLQLQLESLKLGVTSGFDELPVFNVSQVVIDEIALKQAQMKDVSGLLTSALIGADAGTISVV